MTLRIKTVRSPPLLDHVPANLDWRRVSSTDVASMERMLEAGRKCGRSEETTHLLFYMRELGFYRPTTKEDFEAMGKRLDDYSWNAVLVSEIRHGRLRLGLDPQVSDQEWRLMTGELEKCRSEGNGFKIANIHYWMRELGRPQEITLEDKGAMFRQMSSLRRKRDGAKILRMHYLLRGIGLSQKIKEKDVEDMRKDMRRYRSGDNGYMIAEMHYMLESMLPATEERKTPPLPPLKRFGGEEG